MKELIRLLSLEANRQFDDSIFDRLLENAILVKLNKYQSLIDAGEYCADIFIVKKGIIRGTYIHNNTEVTTGFALPGTLLFSFHCYVGNVPSFLRFEACCYTEILRIKRDCFEALIQESHEFTKWVMCANQGQLYYAERRYDVISGDARSRLEALLRKYSDVYPDVPSHIITSSFSESESHRTKHKREIYNRWKNIIPSVPSRIIASYLGITEQHFSKIKREILLEQQPDNSSCPKS